jgi:hypothetical protein
VNSLRIAVWFFPYRAYRRAAFLMLLILLTDGCALQTRVEPDAIRPLSNWGNLSRIEGLKHALSQSPDAPVRVLVIHGMITSKPGYSENLQKRVASQLNLVQIKSTESTAIVRGYDFTVFSGPQPFSEALQLKPSQLRKSTWASPEKQAVGRIIFYEMLWAPLRDDVKNRFLACFESRLRDKAVDCTPFSAAKPNTDPRSLVNGVLKDRILVEGFADATIVLGPIGDVLRDDVSLAMCNIAADTLEAQGLGPARSLAQRCELATISNDRAKVAAAAVTLAATQFNVITHSLGSFLVMDAQQRAAQVRAMSEADTLQETLAFHLLDRATVYMMANQISLLQLGRLTATCTPEELGAKCPNRWLRTLGEAENRNMPLGQMTSYIAFNDIDDLLGFELPPYLADTGLTGPLVNVSVQNPGLSIPFLFKDPSAAHTHHVDNLAVIQALIMGIDLPLKDVKK